MFVGMGPELRVGESEGPKVRCRESKQRVIAQLRLPRR